MTEHIIHVDDIEELVIAKYFIEKDLLNNKEIDKKMSIQEFVSNFLKMNENVAIYDVMKAAEVVPFYIYKNNNDTYVFFAEKTEASERTYQFLKKHNYDFSNLKPYSNGNNLLRVNYVDYELMI